ncbi:MAG: SRPBCC domain-containing protein [Micropruina sp.]
MTDQKASEPLGQSPDTTVVVSRSVSQSVKDVWKTLVTPQGSEALLGPGGVLGDKGHTWQAEDGTYGVVRSFHPLEQIRFSWHAADEAPKTLVDLQLLSDGANGTVLELRHEQIPDDADSDEIARRWEGALAKLAEAS